MISVTTGMIFRVVACSAIFGFLLGAIYALNSCLLLLIGCVIQKRKTHKNKRNITSWIAINIFDFFFATAGGIVYLLILYVFADGVISVYSILTYAIAFLFGKSLMFRMYRACRRRK